MINGRILRLIFCYLRICALDRIYLYVFSLLIEQCYHYHTAIIVHEKSSISEMFVKVLPSLYTSLIVIQIGMFMMVKHQIKTNLIS